MDVSATTYLVVTLAKWDLGCRRDGSLDRLGCETIVVFVTWDFGRRSSSSQRVVFTTWNVDHLYFVGHGSPQLRDLDRLRYETLVASAGCLYYVKS